MNLFSNFIPIEVDLSSMSPDFEVIKVASLCV